jgi:hypothetical protein
VQAFASHVFLDDERSAPVGARTENLDDIGVLKPGERGRLDHKPGSLYRRAGQFWLEEFEGDPPPQIDLLGQVDNAHSASAAFTKDHEPPGSPVRVHPVRFPVVLCRASGARAPVPDRPAQRSTAASQTLCQIPLRSQDFRHEAVISTSHRPIAIPATPPKARH